METEDAGCKALHRHHRRLQTALVCPQRAVGIGVVVMAGSVQTVGQVFRKRINSGVVEDERGGQAGARRGLQCVAQLHRAERVET